MKNIINFFYLLILLLVSVRSVAQTIPAPTEQVVSDFSGILTTEQEELLAKKIKTVYKETGNQLFVITVPSEYYSSITIEEFAQQLFEKWKPGQAGADNGLLLIIGGSQTDSINRALRIHTGYAIETMLTDIESGHIERDVMVPELKQFNYFAAINKGTDEILKKIAMYKVMVLKPANRITFKTTDFIEDNAHTFSGEQLEELKSKNTGILGNHICKIITLYDKLIQNGVSENSISGYTAYNFEIHASPWVVVPIKDSSLALQIGKHFYDFKINSTITSARELESFYFKYGYYKTVLNYIDILKEQQFNTFLLFIALLIIPILIWLASIRISNQQKKKVYTKANVKGNFLLLKIWVWILYIFSSLNVISLTLFYSGFTFLCLTYSSFECNTLSLGWGILIAIYNFTFYVISFIKASDFIEDILGINLSRSGSGTSTYSGTNNSYNSSSSSFSSSSSSSSSYSSSSNSGYSGGGGRSGGGGASSGW